MRNRVIEAIAAGALALTAAAYAGCGREADPAPAGTVEVAYLNHGPDAEYVGRQACQSCHPGQYETFVQSEMGRSFRRAVLAQSDAPWDGVAPIYDEARDLHYQPFRRGESLFVREYRLAGRDTVHSREERIDYIVGSGHHTNSHIRDVNGHLYQVPVTWYAQAGLWGLAPGFGGAGDRFMRPITHACMACHNALPDFVEGSENRFAHVPLGIDCERCHGPGSIHVEERTAGRGPAAGQPDRTIVNPRRLPPDLQLNVCERCHMQGAAVWESDAAPAAFRPGMRLDEYQHVFWPRAADSLAQFTMASHPARLRMSACFQESHEAGSELPALTCLSCHNPHLGIRTVPRERYNATCRSCHTPDRALACTEPTVVRAGGAGDCVSCHMPTSPTTDIPNVTVTDHYIRVVERDAPAPGGAPLPILRVATVVGRNASDLQVAQGMLTYFEEVTNRPGVLDSAAARLERAGRTEPPARMVPALARLHFLRGDHAALRALAGRPEAAGVDAWTHYRFGEAFASAGAHAAALRHLGRAVALLPGHLRFRERLARAYHASGRADEARRQYDAVLGADPTFEPAYNNRGMALLALGDLPAAEADFRRAVDLYPDAEMALANLASVYFNTGRPAAARPLLRRAMDLSPRNDGYRRLWEALEEPPAGHTAGPAGRP